MTSPSPVTHEEIARRAYAIWEQAGRPEGHETEHWLRAENELRAERIHASEIQSALTSTANHAAQTRRR